MICTAQETPFWGMRWVGHVASMGRRRRTFRMFYHSLLLLTLRGSCQYLEVHVSIFFNPFRGFNSSSKHRALCAEIKTMTAGHYDSRPL